MTPPANNAVRINLPGPLAGGNFGPFFTDMGLRSSLNPDGSWNVRPPTTPPELVKTVTLAGPWLKERKFYLLDGQVGQRKVGQAEAQELQALYKKYDALLESRRAAGDPTAWLYRVQTAVMSAADSDIASTADHADTMTIGTLVNTPNNDPVFPHRSCHAMTFDRKLLLRSKLAQVLIGFDQDPQLVTDLASAAAPTGKSSIDGLIFDSNTANLESLMLGGTYLAPLLGCCSPGVWAVHGQRLFSVLIFALGRLMPGVEYAPAEPLQLMPYAWPHGEPAKAPKLTPKSYGEAVFWWGWKLQHMFTYLSDPTYFRDANRNYLPYLHQNWMMTFDQVFQRLGSIVTSYRDPYAEHVLMFGAIDAIGDRIYNCGAKSLYGPTRAQEALDTIRNSIPEDVAELLLPQAERAVKALTDVQDGFFIRKRRGTPNVQLVNSAGAAESWDMDHATRELLMARRNATHGFGHWRSHDGDNVRILAHHDGRLPRDLIHLPYLYLLEILCTPEEVIDSIHKAGDAVT